MELPEPVPLPLPLPPPSSEDQLDKQKTKEIKSPTRPTISLQPSHKKSPSRSSKILKSFRSVFRSFPIIAVPLCKMKASFNSGNRAGDGQVNGCNKVTGTLFGYRKARINLAIQERPRTLPIILLELGIPTGKLLQDMGTGLVRIALECEKKPNEKLKIIEEPIWTLYCNGKKSGYGVKREPNEDDLTVMQFLNAVSMGAGVLPMNNSESGDHPDGELTYTRANFERVVGSKDSETFYMMNPDGNNGPELSIFFVRL